MSMTTAMPSRAAIRSVTSCSSRSSAFRCPVAERRSWRRRRQRGCGQRVKSKSRFAQHALASDASTRVDEDGETDDDDDAYNGAVDPATEPADARDVLQWEQVLNQARALTFTSRGRAATTSAPLASTIEDARALMARTTAALRCGFTANDFEGARDARLAVRGAMKGSVLSGYSLAELHSTCSAQTRLGNKLRDVGEPAFGGFERALCATPGVLVGEIERCVSLPGGKVLDDASEALRAIRDEQRRAREELRTLLTETSREMARKGFAERAQVVTRLGRQCVPMKLGSAGELEGVVLDVSGTGSTVFKEPNTAVPLNNALATLAAREEAEEERILWEITAIVAENGEVLLAANDAMTELDVANARARHARWIDGAEPKITSAEGGLSISQMQHPLLLERYLSALPKGGTIGEEEGVVGWDEEEETTDAEELEADVERNHVNRRDVADIVVPVDFNVDASVRIVAITGPNTGGKTASLKAIGTAALMVRAGLYLPCEEGCVVPFFRDVIADLGDSQSLELDGGLSTFGAHLKGLQRILDAANSETLVLLDEPGSGTDPAEGASLAVAVLNKLSLESRLTVATSHYEEVKDAALSSPVSEVAAVEFDLNTLRPTYRLMWGETGKSNALHIASGLGLSQAILEEARLALAKSDGSIASDEQGNSARENRAKLASALDRECEIQLERRRVTAETLEETLQLYEEMTSKAAHLSLRGQMMKDDAESAANSKIAEARELMAACDDKDELEEVAVGSLPKGWILDASGEAIPEETDGAAAKSWIPEIGSKVIVRQLGTAEADVIDAHPETNEITVRLGRISTRVSMSSGVSRVDSSKKSWKK